MTFLLLLGAAALGILSGCGGFAIGRTHGQTEGYAAALADQLREKAPMEHCRYCGEYIYPVSDAWVAQIVWVHYGSDMTGCINAEMTVAEPIGQNT